MQIYIYIYVCVFSKKPYIKELKNKRTLYYYNTINTYKIKLYSIFGSVIVKKISKVVRKNAV